MDEERIALVDVATGEVLDEVPYGTTVITPEQRKRNAEKKKEREEHELNRNRGKQERYIFIDMMCQFEGLKPSTATELIYLSTFADYDCILKTQKKNDIKRTNLWKILGVSERRALSFWKEVSPAYITENENGQLVLNKSVFKRGKIDGKEGKDYQQFYFKGVRRLYNAVSTREHKQLGHLFKLLPFINIEWNVLCDNPFETDLDKVELISMAEFCALTGNGDVSHVSRLKKAYSNVRFDVDGKQQRFCTMVYDGINERTAKICVNPEVLYVGSNQSRVDVLKLFFKD